MLHRATSVPRLVGDRLVITEHSSGEPLETPRHLNSVVSRPQLYEQTVVATVSRPKLAATIGGDAAWADAMAARQEAKRELTKSSDAIKALRMENTQLRLQMDSLKARARAGASGRTPLPPETRASRIREELNRRAA